MINKRGGARPGAARPKGSIGAKRFPGIKLAQEQTELAFNVLIGIASDPSRSPAARVSAANSILDRGHGKPVQPQVYGAAQTLADAFKAAGFTPESMPIATCSALCRRSSRWLLLASRPSKPAAAFTWTSSLRQHLKASIDYWPKAAHTEVRVIPLSTGVMMS